jgi:hypothetical protein
MQSLLVTEHEFNYGKLSNLFKKIIIITKDANYTITHWGEGGRTPWPLQLRAAFPKVFFYLFFFAG